jgi:SHS2 domain-containing protein
MRSISGFSELEHTADWEIEVWASDFSELLRQAARGMYSLSGTHIKQKLRQERKIQLSAPDRESLLVKFLTELLNLSEQEHLGFDEFQIDLQGDQLQAVVKGAPVYAQDKEIKAVTYHNLSIREIKDGLMVNIVFDV